MQSHLEELERRHAEMERRIEDAQLHPSTDSLELANMKRQKLKIKDEIERIRHDVTIH
ncbi:YdcH family protein [Roseibium salinum]